MSSALDIDLEARLLLSLRRPRSSTNGPPPTAVDADEDDGALGVDERRLSCRVKTRSGGGAAKKGYE